ncbi:TPA: IPT/TIG domain-containing protein [Legionella pneumophila]
MVPQTNFTIQGTNTNALTAAIAIQSGSTLTAINPTSGTASGGTGFTLTGTGLTGATGVAFDGIAATGVNVVNSTTVTGVTPAHAAGAVDVVIDTPAGGATLANGYTYVANAVGQPAFGGTIACLNGGLNNLIAATTDNSTNIEWGGFGTAVGAGAQSDTDGASNTTAIVAALGNNGGTPYAAQLCNDFEVDSQGNTPCQAGNTCYDDWFLPAGNNSTPTGQLNCLFTNRAAIGGFASDFYWSSTEFSGDPTFDAWLQEFVNGFQVDVVKINNLRVRCVRAFTP